MLCPPPNLSLPPPPLTQQPPITAAHIGELHLGGWLRGGTGGGPGVPGGEEVGVQRGPIHVLWPWGAVGTRGPHRYSRPPPFPPVSLPVAPGWGRGSMFQPRQRERKERGVSFPVSPGGGRRRGGGPGVPIPGLGAGEVTFPPGAPGSGVRFRCSNPGHGEGGGSHPRYNRNGGPGVPSQAVMGRAGGFDSRYNPAVLGGRPGIPNPGHVGGGLPFPSTPRSGCRWGRIPLFQPRP